MTKTISLQPATFNTMEEERIHRKERLAASFRLFSKFGFDEGIAGHITVRDPNIQTISGSIRLGCILVKFPFRILYWLIIKVIL